MESLPKECVPVVGTEGERYRRAQCFHQLPLSDFSLEACHKMSDLETKRHTKVTTRRMEVFGVGSVKLQSSGEKTVSIILLSVCVFPFKLPSYHWLFFIDSFRMT